MKTHPIFSLLFFLTFFVSNSSLYAFQVKAHISITGFTLINANNEIDIVDISNEDVINLSLLPSQYVNIRSNFQPNTLPLQIGSVVFKLNGVSRYENAPPYALKGDNNGNYNNWIPAPGLYTLTATPYTGAAGTGIAGTPLTIQFTVIKKPLKLPEAKYRINTGGGDYISPQGVIFEEDNYIFGSNKNFTNRTVTDIKGTDMDKLYKSERISDQDLGSFWYYLPVAHGNYTVKLHFAEIYFGVPGGNPTINPVGKRVFDVNIDNDHALTNFDIAKEAGAAKALVKTFEVSSNDGNITIYFSGKVNRPKISAIEILVSDAPNHRPVANAGDDKFLTLPENNTTLVATWSDEDGDVVSYQWSQLSGPVATIEGENTSNLMLTNLVEGTYVFRFTVIDNQEATDTDEVTLTVLPVSDNVLVYPNPTEQSVSISGLNSSDKVSIKLYNRFGKLLYSMQEVEPKNNPLLNLSSVPAGSYCLNIEAGMLKKTIHIVKK